MPLSTNFITITNFVTITNPITNFITSTNTLATVEILNVPQLEKVWHQDPTFWIPLVATLLSAISTFFMVLNFFRMKKEYIQKELRDYIDKHLLSEYQQIKLDKKNNNNNVTKQSVRNFNFNVLMNLKILYANSAGLFYADSMAELISKIRYYDSIVLYPDNYSDHTQTASQNVFFLIITTLYKSLINKKEFKIFNQDIKTQIDYLEEQLTDEEKEQLKKDNEKRP